MSRFFRVVLSTAANMKQRPGVCWDLAVTVFVALSLTSAIDVHGARETGLIQQSYSCPEGCNLLPDNMCSCFFPPTIVEGPGGPRYTCHSGCIPQGNICFCVTPPTAAADPDKCTTPSPAELMETCKKLIKPPPPVDSCSEKVRLADACGGLKVTIQCLEDQYIEIWSVFWGRRGDMKCERNGGGEENCEDTDGTALLHVVSSCNYRRECTVEADNSILGDPCGGGEAKLLRIKYKCKPVEGKAGFQVSHVCWENELFLKCPAGKILRIQNAVAGRTVGPARKDAPFCTKPKETINGVPCYSSDALSITAKKCSNKNACGVWAYRDTFYGFNCYYNYLYYLKVWYYCVRDKPIYHGTGPLTEKEKRKYESRGQNFG